MQILKKDRALSFYQVTLVQEKPHADHISEKNFIPTDEMLTSIYTISS